MTVVEKLLSERFEGKVRLDAAEENCLITDDGLKLIDFEFGWYGHALRDGIYGRIHFPKCWCVNRLPEHAPPRMEAAYRTELIKGSPRSARGSG